MEKFCFGRNPVLGGIPFLFWEESRFKRNIGLESWVGGVLYRGIQGGGVYWEESRSGGVCKAIMSIIEVPGFYNKSVHIFPLCYIL